MSAAPGVNVVPNLMAYSKNMISEKNQSAMRYDLQTKIDVKQKYIQQKRQEIWHRALEKCLSLKGL